MLFRAIKPEGESFSRLLLFRLSISPDGITRPSCMNGFKSKRFLNSFSIIGKRSRQIRKIIRVDMWTGRCNSSTPAQCFNNLYLGLKGFGLRIIPSYSAVNGYWKIWWGLFIGNSFSEVLYFASRNDVDLRWMNERNPSYMEEAALRRWWVYSVPFSRRRTFEPINWRQE